MVVLAQLAEHQVLNTLLTLTTKGSLADGFYGGRGFDSPGLPHLFLLSFCRVVADWYRRRIGCLDHAGSNPVHPTTFDQSK